MSPNDKNKRNGLYYSQYDGDKVGRIVYDESPAYVRRYILDEIGKTEPFRYKARTFFIWKLFYLHIGQDIIWFRLFNRYGLKIKRPGVRLLFSERNGYGKCLKIFGYRISILKPGGI